MDGIFRVVTGVDPDSGASVVVASGPVQPDILVAEPGMQFAWLWSTDDAGASISQPERSPRASFFPSGHGTRAMIVTHPPGSRIGDPPEPPTASALEVMRRESELKLPGLFDALDYEDTSGFHATATVDYMYLISGELTLELDGERPIVLHPGAFVVQRGARHRWLNHSESPAVALFVMVGASA